MAQRQRKIRTRKFITLTLKTGTAAVKGEIACLDTSTAGQCAPVSTSQTLVPIGYFTDDLTGDGSLTVKIELFDELVAHAFANDSVHPVVAADRGKLCWLKDTKTVSGLSTGRSVAGTVLTFEGTSNAYVVVLMADLRHVSPDVENVSAAVGAEVAVDHAGGASQTLLAAAPVARIVLIEGECTETIAGDNDPTFSVGYSGSVAAAITVAESAALGTAGDHITGSCLLPAGEALLATVADGGDVTNDAGAFVYRIAAVPA